MGRNLWREKKHLLNNQKKNKKMRRSEISLMQRLAISVDYKKVRRN